MNARTLQLGFFIVFLTGISILFFLIAQPYVTAIFLALVTSALFKPLHEKLLSTFGGRKNTAALFSVILVLLVIFVPLLVVGNLLVNETTSIYNEVQGNTVVNVNSLAPFVSKAEIFIEARFPGFDAELSRFLNVRPYFERALVWLSGNLSNFFSGILRLTLGAFLYVLCLFYLFRDQQSLTRNILAWSPLFDSHDKLILSKISMTVISVLRGQLMIGLIQGLLTGIGFWIFGVSHPVVWGSIAAVASLVPAVGTTFVNGPAVIYLLATGHVFQGVGLLVWAIAAVGLIDNLLGPYLINRGVKIHPFLVLVSVLGGISFFGPVGFIAGPVALSLLFALLELYPIIINGRAESTK
jgi:predicted PurR-regulated permease PerM